MSIAEISKLVRIQENMNQICLDILSENVSSVPCLFEEFKNHHLFNNDIIDLLLSEYYIKYKYTNNRDRRSLSNFLESYSSNKSFLYNCFNNNKGMALEFFSSYISDFVEGKDNNKFFSSLCESDKKIAIELSAVRQYIGFNYLPDLARCSLFEMTCELDLFSKNMSIETDKLRIDDISILSRILVSDAYTYMNVNNNDGNFDDNIELIEDKCYNFNDLFNILIEQKVLLYNFLYYQTLLFLETNVYSDVYDVAIKRNPQFLETIKSINPYYIVDLIESHQIKKYRK